MRRVKVRQKKYIGFDPTTAKAVYDYIEKLAFFHTWGVSSVEDGGGNMNDSQAIVEYDCGSVGMVDPHMVIFLDRRDDAKTETTDL